MRLKLVSSALAVVILAAVVFVLARRDVAPAPAAPAAPVASEDVRARGRELFEAKCKECHALNGEGAHKAPALTGYLTRAWLRGVIANPDKPEYFGKTKIRGMDAFDELPAADLDALADFLFALRGYDGVQPDALPKSLQAGRALYEEHGCDSCHALVPAEESAAPNLSGYGSTRWLVDFVADPSTNLFFADDNEMTRFGPRLAPEDIAAVVAYVQEQSALSEAAR